MAYMNNKGDKIGSLDTAISNDNVVAIIRLNDVTTVTVHESTHGQGHGGDFLRRFAIWKVDSRTRATAASRTPLWLPSGWGCLGLRLSQSVRKSRYAAFALAVLPDWT